MADFPRAWAAWLILAGACAAPAEQAERIDAGRDAALEACLSQCWIVSGIIRGLAGQGLSLALYTDVGPNPELPLATLRLSEDGAFQFPQRLADRAHYELKILAQPTAQTCTIDHPGGAATEDVSDVVITCASKLDGLRISEVGSCPSASASCWFELVNTGPVAASLTLYRVRTSALAVDAFIPSRVFTLPSLQLPPSSALVVHGKRPDSMADGAGVIHVAEGDVVPWWGADGFVELLDPAGVTVSFVRFGANTIEPTTSGAWAGGAAPALPLGGDAYGSSIQHASGMTTRSAADWTLRAFATYGGINDVTSDADVDDDGIPDTAEQAGGTFSGLDLYAMGARAGRRDMFVEIDRMAGGDPATTPRKEALQRIVDAFMRHDIAVHFDVGDLFAAGFDPGNFNLGGGNEVPFASAVALAPSDVATANFYDYKAAFMEARRRMIFHYQLFAWSQQSDGSGGATGVSELPGNDSIITLGGLGLLATEPWQRNQVAAYQAASAMHELGHNLGLLHGGGDSLNRKPNYLSVMNYLYSPFGLASIGNAEGDRYALYWRCGLTGSGQLTNPPTGDIATFVIDFSDGRSKDLDERAVVESEGLGRSGSLPVDYDCNGKVEAGYARDLNRDGTLDVLVDHDDWRALELVFRRTQRRAESGRVLWRTSGPGLRDDPWTADTARRSEPCWLNR